MGRTFAGWDGGILLVDPVLVLGQAAGPARPAPQARLIVAHEWGHVLWREFVAHDGEDVDRSATVFQRGLRDLLAARRPADAPPQWDEEVFADAVAAYAAAAAPGRSAATLRAAVQPLCAPLHATPVPAGAAARLDAALCAPGLAPLGACRSEVVDVLAGVRRRPHRAVSAKR
jgi:hypothetical protein